MSSQIPDLGIDRFGRLDRVHLHHRGGSWTQTRRTGGDDHSGGGPPDAPVEESRAVSSSWIDIRPGFLREPRAVLDSVLEDTPWAQGETWRYERYVAEQRLGAMIREDRGHEALRQTGMHLRAAYGSPLAGIAAILYRDGRDFQGLHSDRSMKWLDNTLIAILVVGERRPFVLRPRYRLSKSERLAAQADGSDSAEDVVIHPGHGDLIVMGGRAQRDWLHGVPACDVRSERISLTWRWTARTGRPDPGPVYGEGVHYSDARSRPFRRTRRV